jgi:hypothetical protein
VSAVDPPRFRRADGVLSRRVGADELLATVDDPRIHELSGGAAAAWRDLDREVTLDELVEDLAAEHGVASRKIADQVRTCLDELVAAGVVAMHDAAPRAGAGDG